MDPCIFCDETCVLNCVCDCVPLFIPPDQVSRPKPGGPMILFRGGRRSGFAMADDAVSRLFISIQQCQSPRRASRRTNPQDGGRVGVVPSLTRRVVALLADPTNEPYKRCSAVPIGINRCSPRPEGRRSSDNPISTRTPMTGRSVRSQVRPQVSEQVRPQISKSGGPATIRIGQGIRHGRPSSVLPRIIDSSEPDGAAAA